MYLINKDKLMISKIAARQFFVLGIEERKHLHDWIVNNFDFLGEELLIIQKDYDHSAKANQRLDFLALDKSGNIILIKNELDNSGNDVIWQIVKHSAYSFKFPPDRIKGMYQKYLDGEDRDEKAEDNLMQFYQRPDYESLFEN